MSATYLMINDYYETERETSWEFRNVRFGSAVESDHRAMLTQQSCAIRHKPTRPNDHHYLSVQQA
jgi:hypothetical protein